METAEQQTAIPRNGFIEATKRSIWSWVKFSQFFFGMKWIICFFFSFCHHFFPVCHHLIHVFYYFFIFFSLFTCYSASLCWFFSPDVSSCFSIFFSIIIDAFECVLAIQMLHNAQHIRLIISCLFQHAKSIQIRKWRAEITQKPNKIANFIRSK